MKRIILLCLSFMMLLAVSCKKDKQVIPPVTNPVPLPVDDTAKVLLKDVTASRLPSPYFHFEYDNRKYVTKIGFADNLDVYNLHYQDKRLAKMINTQNNNQVIYTYSDKKVSLITELSGITGAVIWKYYFDYNNSNQLVQVRWLRFENNGNDSVPHRKAILAYYADGNLASIDNFRAGTNGQVTWSSKIQYRDYDTLTNVDDFSLFKDFFDTLLYLPAVKIQKHNHATEIITGTDNDYTITYRYQYNNGLPLSKKGTMVQTRGTGTGQTLSFSRQFSYY